MWEISEIECEGFVGIHIADVTHFVTMDSIWSTEPVNVTPSFVDRLAYSVFVILNEEGI